MYTEIFPLSSLILCADEFSILSFLIIHTDVCANNRPSRPSWAFNLLPLDNPPLIEYSFSDRNVRSAHALWISRRESERNQDGSKKPRSFEQYQLSCIERRPMGAALISTCPTLYRLDFYNRDECRDFKQDASLWDVFFICPSVHSSQR